MRSPRQNRKRANAAASTPFLTLGGFAMIFGILASSSLYVESLRRALPRFDTPGYLFAAGGITTLMAAAFYYREKRRLP